MLGCYVVQRPRGIEIAADIIEAAIAADTMAGGSVLATLVDDPASAIEHVDAYRGEIMLEAAIATATETAGMAYATAIAEAAAAADAPTASMPVTATVVETITAVDAPTATVISASTVTWDAATVTAVTLSGGDLVATNTGTTSANQGAHVISTSGKTSGKYYFEAKYTTLGSPSGNTTMGIGVGTTASTYTNMGNGGTTGDINYRLGGATWSNGSQILAGGGNWAAGVWLGFAVDLDNRKFWFRPTPSGNWNNNVANNPATNVGGLTIPAGTMIPFVTFGGTGGVANNVVTANFGASAFNGAVPSGFTSGWPV